MHTLLNFSKVDVDIPNRDSNYKEPTTDRQCYMWGMIVRQIEKYYSFSYDNMVKMGLNSDEETLCRGVLRVNCHIRSHLKEIVEMDLRMLTLLDTCMRNQAYQNWFQYRVSRRFLPVLNDSRVYDESVWTQIKR